MSLHQLALKERQYPTIPAIPFTWVKTTIPEPPIPLASAVKIDVLSDAIQLVCESGGNGESPAFAFSKDDIVEVEIILVKGEESSQAIIRHRDPLGVEPYFEETFRTEKSYYAKALAKALRDRMGIEVSVMEIPF